jgi:hypothetical protein
LNSKIEVFVSRGSEFVGGCFFFGLCRHNHEHCNYDARDNSPSTKATLFAQGGNETGRERTFAASNCNGRFILPPNARLDSSITEQLRVAS